MSTERVQDLLGARPLLLHGRPRSLAVYLVATLTGALDGL